MSNRRPRWTVAVAAATGCFLLAACSSKSTTKPPAPAASAADTQATATATATATASPTPTGASGGNSHACSLVTEQEASTALGADPGAGQETPSGPGVSNCVYGGLVGPGVKVFEDTSGVGKATYDGARSSYPSSQVTDVPGVGDGAFEIVTSDSQVTVYLYKGGTSVSITLNTAATTGPPKAQALALAKTAASRI